jgi:hypothetical protein
LVKEKESILLYPNLKDKDCVEEVRNSDDLSVVINMINDLETVYNQSLMNKSILRVDPFLGGHGLTTNDFFNINDISMFKSVLIQINEFITSEEFEVLQRIKEKISSAKLRLSIGGSDVFKQIDLLNDTNIDYRFVMSMLFPRERLNIYRNNTFRLKARIINKQIIYSDIEIGYKSNRTKINFGTLLTVAIGYGDYALLPYFFNQKIPILINGILYFLPCYPCMNTCWLLSDTVKVDLSSLDYVTIIDDNIIYEQLTTRFNKDVDEIFTSLASYIPKKYVI